MAGIAVKYKVRTRRYTLDDAISWAHQASGGDSLVLLQADVKQAAVIGQPASDRGDEGNKSDGDLLRAWRSVPDVFRNEQQVSFRCISELGPRVGMRVSSDKSGLLKSVEAGFRTDAIWAMLEREVVDMRPKIDVQVETIA